MNTGFLLGGIGIGAGLMYVLDPERGGRRRGVMRDKAVSAVNKTGEAMGTTSRDIANRAAGLWAEASSLVGGDDAPDEVIEARVRSAMGRVVSHPSAIEVAANDGRVTLGGPILAHEVYDLIGCVASVRGVKGVENRLEVHKEPGDVPALQGGKQRTGPRPEFLQANWSPAARLLAGAAGGAIAVAGFGRGDAFGRTVGLAGLTLLARGASNTELERLFGMGGGRRAVDIQKAIDIAAPVDQVFAFWTRWENFPRFMTNVQEVRDNGEGRTYWTVAGPAGVPVSWDAVVTKVVPNEEIAWKSVEGSVVENAGTVRFEPSGDNATRVTVRLSYNPPAGAIGHGIAALLGADPKSQMDEDLNRMKTLVETGGAPRDAAEGSSSARSASGT